MLDSFKEEDLVKMKYNTFAVIVVNYMDSDKVGVITAMVVVIL